MTPQPPGSQRSESLTGQGLVMSKRRNSRNPGMIQRGSGVPVCLRLYVLEEILRSLYSVFVGVQLSTVYLSAVKPFDLYIDFGTLIAYGSIRRNKGIIVKDFILWYFCYGRFVFTCRRSLERDITALIRPALG